MCLCIEFIYCGFFAHSPSSDSNWDSHACVPNTYTNSHIRSHSINIKWSKHDRLHTLHTHTHTRCVIYVNKSLNFKTLPHNSFIFVFCCCCCLCSFECVWWACPYFLVGAHSTKWANERTRIAQPCVQFQQSSCNKWIFIQMSCLTISFIFLLMVIYVISHSVASNWKSQQRAPNEWHIIIQNPNKPKQAQHTRFSIQNNINTISVKIQTIRWTERMARISEIILTASTPTTNTMNLE